MSDRTSTRSNDGTASECSDVSLDFVQISRQCLQARLAPNGANTALTKDNLRKNNSVLANQKRLFEAPETVDSIAAAFTNMSDQDLPSKAERQLLEDKSGVSPMQRFLKTEDDLIGGLFKQNSWNLLKLHDPLAAELDSL